MSVETFLSVRLGNIAEIQTGPFGSQLHKDDYVLEGTPIITVEHLGENYIAHNGLPRVRDEDKERLKRYVICEGDIVFSRVGSVDRRAYVSKKEHGWLFSGRCLRVRVTDSNVSGKYLSYYFGLESFKEYIRSIAVGATMPSINTKILSDVIIASIPPLTEQKAIAATLSALDDAIELNNQINKKLEEMAQAIFKSWFVDFEPFKDGEFEESELGLIPKGWRVGCLGEICDINMGQSPSSETYNSVGVGMPFYQGVKDFGFKYPKVSTYCSKPKKVANSFDILFSVRAPVGEINFAYEKCCIGRGVSALRLKHHKNNILYYWLKTITKQFHDASNGSIFDAINKSGIERVKVVIPNDENVIDKFNEFIEPMDMELFNNFVSTKVLTSLRDTLLPKLMSGEIRVPVEEVEQLV